MSRKGEKEQGLPEGWWEVSLEEICHVIVSPVDKKTVDGERPVKLCNYTDVYYNNYIDSYISFATATAKIKEIEKFSITKGDVIITKDSETPEDIGVPTYVKETIDNLLCGYHLTILRPKKQTIGKYLFYALTSSKTKHSFYRYANGITRFGLAAESYRKIKIPISPLPEQKAIASVLETWDTAIEKTEALIDAKERQFGWFRLKIFDQATKNGKPLLLDELVKFTDGYPFLSSEYCEDGIYNILTIANVQYGNMVKSFRGKLSNIPNKVKKDQILDFGDVLISMTGNVGRVCRVDMPNCLLNQRVGKLKANEKMDNEFLYFSLSNRKFLNTMIARAQGGAQGNLSKKDILKYQISLPPLSEQKRIAEILNTAEQEIDLLKKLAEQYRIQKRGLMQRLLTGQWRVSVA